MQRYSKISFPSYRYVPGKNPHPGIDPKGHSYGKEEEKLSYLPPEQWQKNESYLYGVDLFNHGYWWEAHEAWENVWLTTQKFDLEGRYLQALIQFSAGLLKLYSGSRRGFENLYREARDKMKFCLQELDEQKNFMGLEIRKWLEQVEGFRISLKEHDEGRDPLLHSRYPSLILK